MTRGKILLLGDSITQMSFSPEGGWGGRLSDRYQRRLDVINRGFSGYNTSWLLEHAATEDGRSDLFDHGPGGTVKLVTIFFGANDAAHAELNGRQHVPLETYMSNLKKIVGLVRENLGEEVSVVLISPPPVCHEGRLRFQRERYGDKATGKLERTLELSGKYARAAGVVAQGLGLPFLDLWTTMQFDESSVEERGNWRGYLSDGLHLSPKGNKFVADALLGLIDGQVPHLSVTPCPITGNINSASTCVGLERTAPWHDEIDTKHPGDAFSKSE